MDPTCPNGRERFSGECPLERSFVTCVRVEAGRGMGMGVKRDNCRGSRLVANLSALPGICLCISVVDGDKKGYVYVVYKEV